MSNFMSSNRRPLAPSRLPSEVPRRRPRLPMPLPAPSGEPDTAAIVGCALAAGRVLAKQPGDAAAIAALEVAARALIDLAAGGDPTARVVEAHLRRHRVAGPVMASLLPADRSATRADEVTA